MMTCGIDPGISGAIVYLGVDDFTGHPMPLTPDGDLDLEEINSILRFYADKTHTVYLERTGMRRDQNAQSAFKSGYNMGIFEGLLIGAGLSYRVVEPKRWSAMFPHGVEEKDPAKRYQAIKLARRAIVQKLFPRLDLRKTERSTVPDSGLVDALLIAAYGRNTQQLEGQHG